MGTNQNKYSQRKTLNDQALLNKQKEKLQIATKQDIETPSKNKEKILAQRKQMLDKNPGAGMFSPRE